MPKDAATHPAPRRSPVEKHDSSRMSEMFTTISPRYDSFTRVFSFGMDSRWKRIAADGAVFPPGALVLDLAAGTGDFTRLVERTVQGARSVALDLTLPMLRSGLQRGIARAVCGDAMRLPFRDGEFDSVFVGYGLRNFPELGAALGEIHRVLKSGGCLVSLDFYLPSNLLLRRLYLGYLYIAGWLFGLVLHGRPAVYTYIRDSLSAFMTVDDCRAEMERNGFRQIATRRFLFGGIGVHWAAKEG